MATTEDKLDPAFIDRVAAPFRLLRNYSRLKVSGIENVPTEGPALLVANHTGWLGLDYAFTALSVYDGLGRVPRGMAHAAWFKAPQTRDFATKMGLFQISKDAMKERLARGDLVMLFPEGEKGAFRPGNDYELEPFARGFVRIAMETGVPVIPVAILGGEEANPVGVRIESYEELLGLQGGLPIPKNVIPKPVKWRLKFLEPKQFGHYGVEGTSDSQLCHGLAALVKDEIQAAIRKMKKERGNPWL